MTVSAAHEQRVELLAAMGHLGGCHREVRLDALLDPDVVLANGRRRVLLVGDGKETETAGRQATVRRLRRYVRGVQAWRRAGFTVRIAVCAPSSSGDWELLLRSLVHPSRPYELAGGSVAVDPASRVSWIDLPALPTVGQRRRGEAAAV